MIFEILKDPQASDQWFASRHGMLTASKARRFANAPGGLSAGADALAAELIAEAYCAMLDDRSHYSGHPCTCDWDQFGGSKDTDRGNELEPEALYYAQLEVGAPIEQVGLCIHARNGILGFSPDGLIRGDDGEWISGVEVKCPRLPKHIRTILDGGIPEEHLAQINFSLAVSGLPAWWFVSYVEGRVPFVRKVSAGEGSILMAESITKMVARVARSRAAAVESLSLIDELRKSKIEELCKNQTII